MVHRLHVLLGLVALLFATSASAQNTAATVPDSFLGTYTATYELINNGGPFSQGEEVTFVLGANNTLCINGQTLTDPVHVNGNTIEGVWTDSSTNVSYAISNFTSTFNEVNISGPNFSPFYGQLSASKTSDSTSCSGGSTTTTPEITAEMTTIFELAESRLGQLFPSGAVTQTLDQYVYRYYESTGIYLAFADGNVLLLGGECGDAIVNVGPIRFVTSELQKLPAVGGGSVETWNLSISGSFNTPFIQNLTFGGINLAGVPAPDLTNVEAVNQEIVNSLAGVASGISSISFTVVENSASRRAFDVSFSATVTGIGNVTYNLRYDYTR
jgi:hypothetical protein